MNPYGPMREWNVSLVTDFSGLFSGPFNGDISSWDTSSAKTMSAMFQDAVDFNNDISLWDVSQVTSMDNMFDGARSFNQDLSLWNVTSATTMGAMFRNAVSFDADVTSWCLLDDTDATLPCTHMRADEMFSGATAFGEKFYWVGLRRRSRERERTCRELGFEGRLTLSSSCSAVSTASTASTAFAAPAAFAASFATFAPSSRCVSSGASSSTRCAGKTGGNSPCLFDASCVCRR